jgi:hypothetical protein
MIGRAEGLWFLLFLQIKLVMVVAASTLAQNHLCLQNGNRLLVLRQSEGAEVAPPGDDYLIGALCITFAHGTRDLKCAVF